MTKLSAEQLERLKALAEQADPKRDMGKWYVVEQPWLPPGAEPYVVSGNPDPHVAKYVCDFVDVSIAGHEDEFSDDEWSARNWALAEYVASVSPEVILELIRGYTP